MTGCAQVIDEYRARRGGGRGDLRQQGRQRDAKLGQARGIAMLVPARAGIAVAEYAPNLVKKTIVGAGHAEKAQIRMMIGVLLPKADPPTARRRRRARDRGDPCASSRRARC